MEIIGNLTSAPEVRETGGKLRARFTVAQDTWWRGSDGTRHEGDCLFFAVEAWGREAVVARDHLDSGSGVVVVGDWRASTWKNEQGERRRRQWVTARAIGVRPRVSLPGRPAAEQAQAEQAKGATPAADSGQAAETPEPAGEESIWDVAR